MFSDHDETSPSIAAVSAPSVACSMLALQQQTSGSQFNNIMAVMEKNSNELTTLHLVKTYCLLCYLTLKSGICLIEVCIRLMWHRIYCFRYIFREFWRESVKWLTFSCGLLPLSYSLDQRRILFWKRTLSYFIYNRAMAVGSVYNV